MYSKEEDYFDLLLIRCFYFYGTSVSINDKKKKIHWEMFHNMKVLLQLLL